MDARTWFIVIGVLIVGAIIAAGLLAVVSMQSSRFTAQQKGTKYDPNVIDEQAKKSPPSPPTPPPTSLE